MAAAGGGRRRTVWIVLAAAAILLLVGGLYAYRRAAPYGEVGSTYIAKQLCSCVFVAGRSEGTCRADFKPDIDRFSVKVDRTGAPASGRVSASLALFYGEATYQEGFGCTVSR